MAVYEKAAWKGKSAMEVKPWGTETKWSALRSVSGKMLNIKEGHRTSLKYNKRKDEAFYVMNGKVKFYYADEEWLHYKDAKMKSTILQTGESMNVQSMCVYRIHALEESLIIEIGDFQNGSDFVRIEDDYGRHVTNRQLPNAFEE